jgi:hypothetical protein
MMQEEAHMDNDQLRDSQKLEKGTNALESAIEVTRVPGELGEWVTGVSRALNNIYEILTDHVLPQHQRDFAEILANDIALKPRVDELSAVDHELCQQVNTALEVAANIENILARSDGQVEAGGRADALFEQCVLLVIRLRKQESDVSSWFVEALQRDRGVVD